MPNLFRYKKEHAELLRVIDNIEPLDHISVSGDPLKARGLIHELTDIATTHMAREGEDLYPKLFVHHDESIRFAALKFYKESEEIAEMLISHKERWQCENLIENSSEDFLKETTSVISVLLRRIEKEDLMLFPLVEGVA